MIPVIRIHSTSRPPYADGILENSMLTPRRFVAAASIAAFLAGCQTVDPYTEQPKTSNATQGAIIGGLAGAAIGALSNSRQAGTNALIGGAVGAVAGGAIGNYMDQQEADL